jgi:type IV secretory pathway VirB10-like protein
MSRIENKVPEPPPKSPPPPKADQNKSAEKGAFASKMQLKKPEGDAKTNTRTMSESAKSDKSDSSLGQSAISSEEQSPSTLLMQRHGSSVIDRRSGGGTVADLMAQLQQESQSKAQKLSGGELDTQASAAASANAQQIGSTGLSLENSATIQVQGTRIPNAMLDKISIKPE